MTAYGIDYSYWRPPQPWGSWFQATGTRFVCRYEVPNNAKSLTAPEAQELLAAGVDIVALWEGDGHWEILAGYQSGVQVAEAWIAYHRSIGGPEGCACYFSVDFDGRASDCIPFFEGTKSVLDREGFLTGCYGSFTVVGGLFDAGLITHACQCYAWSYGQWDPRAQLRQVLNGAEYDHDIALSADTGSWLAAKPKPTPTTAVSTVAGPRTFPPIGALHMPAVPFQGTTDAAGKLYLGIPLPAGCTKVVDGNVQLKAVTPESPSWDMPVNVSPALPTPENPGGIIVFGEASKFYTGFAIVA